jgi:Flp pilus assembly protein TadB
VAQTRKKRRRKHRGTQGGRIDRSPARGRARSRAEARARAKSRTKKRDPRTPNPPSWNSSLKKAGIASVLFFALLAVMGQPPLSSALIAILMMGFYVPMAYLLDRFLYQRHQRKEAEKRLERERQRTGQQQSQAAEQPD